MNCLLAGWEPLGALHDNSGLHSLKHTLKVQRPKETARDEGYRVQSHTESCSNTAPGTTTNPQPLKL